MKTSIILILLLFNLSIAVCQKAIDSMVLVKCIITEIKPSIDTMIYVASVNIFRISGGFKPKKNEIIFNISVPKGMKIGQNSNDIMSIYKHSIERRDTLMIFLLFKNKELHHYFDINSFYKNSIIQLFSCGIIRSSYFIDKTNSHWEKMFFDVYDAYYLPNFNDRVEKLKVIIEKQNSGAFLVLLDNLLNGYRGVNLGEGNDIADSILFYPKDERIKIQIYKDWLRNDSLSFFFKQQVDELLCKNANTNKDSYRYKYEERIGYFETMLLHIKENSRLPEEEKEKQINEVKRYLSQILHDLELRIPFYTDQEMHFQTRIVLLKKKLAE